MSGLELTTSLAHNISSAVFRVARIIRHKMLRGELEAGAIRLVRNIDMDSLSTLTRLVRLSEAVGEMSEINAQVLCRELGNLRGMMIAESNVVRKDLEDVDIGSIFSSPTHKISDTVAKKQSVQAKDRQAAILQFIRQFPSDCRMKDLVLKFPGTSERTLRSDVQRLITDGLIERLGGKSGPFSYFRALNADGPASTSSRQGGQEVSDESAPVESILLPETTMGR